MIWHWFSLSRIRGSIGISLLNDLFFELSEIAVVTFFVLSGFVLTASLTEKIRVSRSWRLIPAFYFRRILRIFPMVILVSITAYLVFYWYRYAAGITIQWDRYSDFRIKHLVRACLLIGREFNPVGWTLYIEIMAYLMFPFVILTITSRSWKILIHAAMACGVYFLLRLMNGSHTPYPLVFLTGIVLYFVVRKLSQAAQTLREGILCVALLTGGLIFSHVRNTRTPGSNPCALIGGPCPSFS